MICLHCKNEQATLNTDNTFCEDCAQELTLIKKYDETTPYDLPAVCLKSLTTVRGFNMDDSIKYNAAYRNL